MRRALTSFGFTIIVLLLSTLINFGPNILPVKAEQSFSDNFNDDNANSWTQQLATWTVTDGEYRVSVGYVKTGLSTVNQLSFSDCIIETQVRFSDAIGFRAGIVFRYLDNQYYYSLDMSNEYNTIELMKHSPSYTDFGELLPLTYGNNSITIDPNVNYQLKLEAIGPNFLAYLNGQKVLSATDASYASGLVGLRATRADANFDNFIVNGQIQPVSPTPIPSPIPSKIPLPTNGSLSDDFSTDSGLWQYLRSAYKDQTNQDLVLTNSNYFEGGVAFLNTPIQGPFTANFRYKVGGGDRRGDGFTMFFYKQKYSTVGLGGGLGFNNETQFFPGYGIEFDAWQNIPQDFKLGPQPNLGDPSPDHIALIENDVGNHLAYVNDERVADNNWHQVCVVVGESSVSVYVDQGLVLQWNGVLNRTYDELGFSGTTAGLNSMWHIIDDFSITAQNLQTPSLTTTCITSESQLSFNVKINGYLTVNGSGIPNAPILISYSVTGGDSWQDLTLVQTDSDGYYSALWLLSVTGEYQVKAVYKGSGNYLGTSNIVNFAMEPGAEQNVFSINSNSTLSALTFNSTSKELSFSVSGESGTTGYINAYIPKSLINDTAGLRVYLDNNPIDFTVHSQGDCWLLSSTYHHSSHLITIGLASSTATSGSFVPNGFLENYIIYIIGGFIAIFAIALVLAFKAARKSVDNHKNNCKPV